MLKENEVRILMELPRRYAVPDKQLHVNSRRWSSTSAVRQSVEVDCPALLI